MIEAALILAAVLIGLSGFWEDIVSFVKDTLRQAQRFLEGILYGTKVFLEKIGSAVTEIARHYSKKGNQWYEQTKTKMVSASEVPADILAKAERAERQNKVADISHEVEMKLTA